MGHRHLQVRVTALSPLSRVFGVQLPPTSLPSFCKRPHRPCRACYVGLQGRACCVGAGVEHPANLPRGQGGGARGHGQAGSHRQAQAGSHAAAQEPRGEGEADVSPVPSPPSVCPTRPLYDPSDDPSELELTVVVVLLDRRCCVSGWRCWCVATCTPWHNTWTRCHNSHKHRACRGESTDLGGQPLGSQTELGQSRGAGSMCSQACDLV
jgi:hypothetical protein